MYRGITIFLGFFFIILFDSCNQNDATGTIVTLIDKKANSVEKGLLVNGRREGYWVTFDTNYVIQYDIQYRHGIPNGKTTNFWGGKIAIEAEEIDGNREGKFTSYHDYPIIEAQGYVKNGKRIGEWRTYTKDGKLNKIIQFENDTFKIVLDNNPE
jgi:uncharacterized protein